MKSLITCFFCFITLAFHAQEKAIQLHEAAKTRLSEVPLKAFGQIEALDKLRHSQKILKDSAATTMSLFAKNDSLLQTLQVFFIITENTDSLLALSRFYPDSVFQKDERYSKPFKDLVGNYLSTRSKVLRKAFLNFRHLNEGVSNSIDFENYWPLEVLEFDAWLNRQEKRVQSFSTKARQALLYDQLKQKLDSLKLEDLNNTYQQNTDRLLESINELELKKQALSDKNKRLSYFALLSLLLVLVVGYLAWQRAARLLENKHQSLLEEKKRSEDLLANMLPSEVVRELKNDKIVKAQSYELICILFTDFQDFSKISEHLPPEELVRELDYCFSNFDQIIEKHHLQKIKTIGDAYMCVGGLYTKGTKHVQRMVAAALEIQEFLRYRSLQKDELGGYFFEARVGIHTGPVVAGVIGTKQIAFDVWGDSVNIAQQMEQHCQVRTVNISSATHELVKDYFDCTYRGEIEVKNGKRHGMYEVSGEIHT
ncbi:MAG: adenylate/guanylate cyclase domain-containing protein [Bacteroidota bacterium]